MTKCKVCHGEKSNVVHLLGHHSFLPDTIDVGLPLPGPESNADESNTTFAGEAKGETGNSVSGRCLSGHEGPLIPLSAKEPWNKICDACNMIIEADQG